MTTLHKSLLHKDWCSQLQYSPPCLVTSSDNGHYAPRLTPSHANGHRTPISYCSNCHLRTGSWSSLYSSTDRVEIAAFSSSLIGWSRYPFRPHRKHQSSVACAVMSWLLFYNAITVLSSVILSQCGQHSQETGNMWFPKRYIGNYLQ
jgi:hypothetical protein